MDGAKTGRKKRDNDDDTMKPKANRVYRAALKAFLALSNHKAAMDDKANYAVIYNVNHLRQALATYHAAEYELKMKQDKVMRELMQCENRLNENPEDAEAKNTIARHRDALAKITEEYLAYGDQEADCIPRIRKIKMSQAIKAAKLCGKATDTEDVDLAFIMDDYIDDDFADSKKEEK